MDGCDIRVGGAGIGIVDSDVLLDILIPDPEWEEWSSKALARTAEDTLPVITPRVYAEVGIGFEREENLDEAVRTRIEALRPGSGRSPATPPTSA